MGVMDNAATQARRRRIREFADMSRPRVLYDRDDAASFVREHMRGCLSDLGEFYREHVAGSVDGVAEDPSNFSMRVIKELAKNEDVDGAVFQEARVEWASGPVDIFWTRAAPASVFFVQYFTPADLVVFFGGAEPPPGF